MIITRGAHSTCCSSSHAGFAEALHRTKHLGHRRIYNMKALTIAVSVVVLGFLAAVFVIPASAKPQQPIDRIPIVAQCRADQKMWFAKLEASPVASGPSDVTYSTLTAWFGEMDACGAVDPQNEITYYNTQSETVGAQSMRTENFIRRRNLFNQFIAKDAAGQR